MITDVFDSENSIEATQIQNAHSALQAIKDNHCQKCGTQAKGFIDRRKLPVYYCKKCLYEEFGVEKRM